MAILEGLDRNNDFTNTDIPDRAFAFDGVGRAPRDTGPCLTINCGRGAASTQFSFRLSKRMPVAGGSRLEAIAELFNVFNASHPSNPSMVNNRRFLGTVQRPEVNQDFMQPASFSGDFQRPEQRVGQLALRWTF